MIKAIRQFLYPEICVHCERDVHDERLLCPECFDSLTPLDRESRCRICLIPLEESSLCHSCKKSPSFFGKLHVAFEPSPVIQSLLREMSADDPKNLARVMASFLLLLRQPVPDIVIPMISPSLFRRSEKRKPSALIAKAYAHFTGAQYQDLFYYKNVGEHCVHLQPMISMKKSEELSLKKMALITDCLPHKERLKELSFAAMEYLPIELQIISVTLP